MEIFGVRLDKLKYNDFFASITKLDKSSKIFTPNPEILVACWKDKNLVGVLRQGDYFLPDGIGLYIAFQIMSSRLPKFLIIFAIPYYIINIFLSRKKLYEKYGDRICGSDLTGDLLRFADQKNKKIAIYDLYNPSDAKKVESQKHLLPALQTKYPNINFLYIIYDISKKQEFFEQTRDFGPDIVLATMGLKKQEDLINELASFLDTSKNNHYQKQEIQGRKKISQGVYETVNDQDNVFSDEESRSFSGGGTIYAGIGSSIDYQIGFQKRAPKIWRTLGIEWLYRLLTGPRKLNRLHRLWNAIFVFNYLVLKNK